MSHGAAAHLVLAALALSACNEAYFPNERGGGGGGGGSTGGGGSSSDMGGGSSSSDLGGGGVITGQRFARLFGGSGIGTPRGLATDGLGGIVMLGTYNGTLDPGRGALTSGSGTSVFLARYDSTGAPLWSKTLASKGSEPLGLQALAVSPAGDIVVAGACAGDIDLGGGSLAPMGPGSDDDVCVARYRKDGAHVFSRRLGDNAVQQARAVALDDQGAIYVAGTLFGSMTIDGTTLRSAGSADAFLLKLDANGKLLFSNVSGDGSTQEAQALQADGEGGVIIAGSFQGTLTLAMGAAPLLSLGAAPSLFLGRIGPGGALRWQRSYTAQLGALAQRSGVTALFGPLSAMVDFGGGPLPVQSAGAYAVTLDDSGKVLQQRTLGGASASVTPGGVGLDGAGRLLLAGRYSGALDLGGTTLPATQGLSQPFLVRLGADGALLSGRAYTVSGPAPNDAQVNTLAVDSGGAALLAGSLTGKVAFVGSAALSSSNAAPYLTRPDQ